MSWKAASRALGLACVLAVSSCGSTPRRSQPAPEPGSDAAVEIVEPEVGYVHDGARYHRDDCRRGRRGQPIPLMNAERHFAPCRVCIPPQ